MSVARYDKRKLTLPVTVNFNTSMGLRLYIDAQQRTPVELAPEHEFQTGTHLYVIVLK